MKKTFTNLKIHNENGSVLVVVVLVLIIMTLIGFAASNSSNIGMQIAGNDKFTKTTFHEADGGTEAAISLIEENFGCYNGFPDPPNPLYNPTWNSSSTDPIILGQVIIPDGEENQLDPAHENTNFTPPNSVNRNTFFYYTDDIPTVSPPPLALATQPHVNQTYNKHPFPGEPPSGFSLAETGAYPSAGIPITVDLPAQRVGPGDCENCVRIQWVHITTQTGDCTFY